MHRKIATHLDTLGLVHRPGLEGVLTRAQRIRMAQVGMRAGWPDIHLPAQRMRKPCWVELKAPGRKPTAEQWAMMAWLEEQGAMVAWFDSADRCMAWIDGIYGGLA